MKPWQRSSDSSLSRPTAAVRRLGPCERMRMSESPVARRGPGLAREEAPSAAMAETQSAHLQREGGERRRLDLLTGGAVVFFLLAVGFTAWVALNSSPVLLATLMLLTG